MCHLRLPGETILAEDLRSDLEILGALEQAGTDHDLVTEDGLVVVHVGGAIGAVVAVDRLAWEEVSELLGQADMAGETMGLRLGSVEERGKRKRGDNEKRVGRCLSW